MVKNIILAIHGLGGRGAWFGNLRETLSKAGIELISPDLKGFGTNEPRGHVDSFHEWVNQIQDIYESLKETSPEARISLIGHSMGAVVLSHIEVDPKDRLIYSVPGFKGAKATFKLSFTLSTLFKLFLDSIPQTISTVFQQSALPKYSLVKLPSSQLTKHITDEDPLKVYDVSPRLLFEILKMSQGLEARLSKLENPILFLQVENDLVIDNARMDELFKLINSDKKELKILYNTEHDWIWDKNIINEASEIILEFLKIN